MGFGSSDFWGRGWVVGLMTAFSYHISYTLYIYIYIMYSNLFLMALVASS